jgi:hypothetical protein
MNAGIIVFTSELTYAQLFYPFYKRVILYKGSFMKCQNCGNELGQEEVFCGQCGAPNAMPAQPTEMMQAPVPRSGLLSDAYRNRTSAFPPNQTNPAFTPESVSGPQQSAIRQSQPQQGGGFYQDSTEAIQFMASPPANYPPSAYPQQGFNGGSMAGGYPGSGQFGSQVQPQQPQFLTGNYPNQAYPSTQMGLPSGQFTQSGFGTGSGFGAPQPAPKRSNVVMIVGIVCLVFAIITVGVFGAIFALRGNNQPQPTPVVQATATPTSIPSPTATATPSPTPTIAVTPTPAPDANFSWCAGQCTQNGFLIEVYQGWGTQATTDQGVQFLNPDQQTYVAVKAPTGSSSPTDLINNDLQEVASQNSATPTTPLSACPSQPPIGGNSWTCETTTLQTNGQNQTMLETMIYATIYQGKAYVIELVASQDTFTTNQNTYFMPMLNSFKFVAPAQ